MRLRMAWLSLMISWTAGAQALTPEYEVQFSDVSHLKKALGENAWAKEMAQSNLYRGGLVKLGPVLFAVGSPDEDSWKGRLLDFLYEKVLEGKRMSLSYFHQAGLVSPFGVSVFNLSAAESAVLSLLVQKHKLAEPVLTDIEIAGEAGTEDTTVKGKVQPVMIRLQKFAISFGAGCFGVSRDPKVAAWLGYRCAKVPQKKNDAVVTVNLKEFFPAWHPVLNRLAGIGGQAELAFDYDKRQASFLPARAEVALQTGHIVGQGKIDTDLLSAIPADTLFQVTAFVPDPGPLSAAGMETYFKTAKDGKRAAVPVSLLYFGMHPGLNTRPEAMSAVILPQADINDALFAQVNRLFNETTSFEVKYAKVCGRYLALSPSKDALDKISAACEKKLPSYAQMPQFLVKALTQDTISAGTVLNLGGFLRSTLAFGWEKENPPAATGAKADVPREIAQAMDLLGRLPLYAFAGKAEKDKLALNGVKP
jgi:hypothetical protein